MLLPLQLNQLLGSVTLDTVPDVVGETQAQGTIDIEAVGFVVGVQTAYSSVVASGLIISQDPIGGTSYPVGGLVTIVVSLGEAPVQSQNAGGFWFAYEREQARRRKRRRELEEAEDEAQKLKDAVDREIAELLQEQERKAEFQRSIDRLKGIVSQYADREAKTAMSERVRIAMTRAMAQESVSAYLALQRELDRQIEEEEFAILMILATE